MTEALEGEPRGVGAVSWGSEPRRGDTDLGESHKEQLVVGHPQSGQSGLLAVLSDPVQIGLWGQQGGQTGPRGQQGGQTGLWGQQGGQIGLWGLGSGVRG